MSWFRSSRRKRSREPAEGAGTAAAVATHAGPPRAELVSRPLADLHALAREHGLPRYRLLRREQLIDALAADGSGSVPVATEQHPEPDRDEMTVDEARQVTGELVGAIGRLVGQLSSGTSAPSASELEEVVTARATRLLVARDSRGEIVGTLTLVIFRTPTGTRAWIEDVVVDERARGRGAGEALTREAIRRAAQSGARTVDLTSRPQRREANRMYDRIGFQRRETHVYRVDM